MSIDYILWPQQCVISTLPQYAHQIQHFQHQKKFDSRGACACRYPSWEKVRGQIGKKMGRNEGKSGERKEWIGKRQGKEGRERERWKVKTLMTWACTDHKPRRQTCCWIWYSWEPLEPTSERETWHQLNLCTRCQGQIYSKQTTGEQI